MSCNQWSGHLGRDERVTAVKHCISMVLRVDGCIAHTDLTILMMCRLRTVASQLMNLSIFSCTFTSRSRSEQTDWQKKRSNNATTTKKHSHDKFGAILLCMKTIQSNRTECGGAHTHTHIHINHLKCVKRKAYN